MPSDERKTILKALVVDDEPLARDGLRLLLQEQDIGEIIQARTGYEAATLIRNERPDIVFLDIQMPTMDGFAVIEEVGIESMPAIVFVTAHNQYAIQAFEFNAIDYLLKPVTRERFLRTLERVHNRLRSRDTDHQQTIALLQMIASPPKYLARIALRTPGKIVFVNVEDISWIQAAENYVQLHLHNPSPGTLLHVPINTVESSLDPAMFMRIHRSLIVNTQQIKELISGTHGEFTVKLHNGTCLQSSRTYHDKIKNWAANPF